MKTKIKNQKLVLSKQTIAALSILNLDKIKGGSNNSSIASAPGFECTMDTTIRTQPE